VRQAIVTAFGTNFGGLVQYEHPEILPVDRLLKHRRSLSAG